MAPVDKKARSPQPEGRKGAVAAVKAPVASVSLDEPRMPRAGSKLALLVDLLERKEGATIEELAGAVGWQAHSVRGVMSGILAKKFELPIVSEKIEGRDRTYRARGHSRA
jgi:hypothetical protein